MARQMDNLEIVLYRAVIETIWQPAASLGDHEEQTYYRFMGPFLTQSAAQTAINRALRRQPPGNRVVTGHIEITDLNWRPNA